MPEPEGDRINRVAAELSADAAVLISGGLDKAAENGALSEVEIPHAYLVTGVYSLTNAVGGFIQCVLNRPLTQEERKDVLDTIHKECGPTIRQLITKYVPLPDAPSKTT